jgi:hypothetical protein
VLEEENYSLKQGGGQGPTGAATTTASSSSKAMAASSAESLIASGKAVLANVTSASVNAPPARRPTRTAPAASVAASVAASAAPAAEGKAQDIREKLLALRAAKAGEGEEGV